MPFFLIPFIPFISYQVHRTVVEIQRVMRGSVSRLRLERRIKATIDLQRVARGDRVRTHPHTHTL